MMKNIVEDFICEVCGEKIIGTGTTDHCPNCLWGKHVDDSTPGDRSSQCKGLMRPMAAEYRNGNFKIFYKCERCNHEFWVRAAEGNRERNDNRELLLELIKNIYIENKSDF